MMGKAAQAKEKKPCAACGEIVLIQAPAPYVGHKEGCDAKKEMEEEDEALAKGLVQPRLLAQLREKGGNWALFRNEAMDSAGFGHGQYIRYGEGCTLTELPLRCPDTKYDTGWKYVLRGTVNLETGEIVPVEKKP